MPRVTQIGLNISAMNNVPPPNYTSVISNDPKEIIRNFAVNANSITNNWYGFGVLVTMLVGLYWILAEKTQDGNFGYSNIRALTLSTGIVSILGLVMVNTGIIYSFRWVAFFLFLMVGALMYLAYSESTVG